MRKLIILIFLLPTLLFAQNQIDVKDAEIRRYFIWDNDSNRNASTADSVIGFISGSDTATMIPVGALGGFWTENGYHLYVTNLNDSVAIGQTTPDHRLTVNGRMSAAYDTTDRDYFLCADSSGGVISLMSASSGDTSYFDLSATGGDITLKSGIDTLGLQTSNMYDNTSLFIQPANSKAYINGHIVSGDSDTYPCVYKDEKGATNQAIFRMWTGVNYGFGGDYSKPSIIVNGSSKLTATSTGIGIGELTPDSLLHVTGGATITGDVLVGGGWTTWTPTLAWTGGTPGASSTLIARYQVVNNTVTYVITIAGTNDSGSSLTALTVTMPITPKDNNTFPDAGGLYSVTSEIGTSALSLPAYVNCTDATPGNRKIYTNVSTFTILNAADYGFSFAGHYEIVKK